MLNIKVISSLVTDFMQVQCFYSCSIFGTFVSPVAWKNVLDKILVCFHLNCSMFILTVYISSSSTMCMGLFEMMAAFHHHPWIQQLRTCHKYFFALIFLNGFRLSLSTNQPDFFMFQNVFRPPFLKTTQTLFFWWSITN